MARSVGTAEEADNLEEVRAEDLIKGKNYYIEMVGPHKNEYRKSGKAIGITFTEIITYEEIKKRLKPNKFKKTEFGGLGLDWVSDKPNQKFVVFNSVVPVNRGVRECGICKYSYFPPIPDDWDKMTDKEKSVSRGGYKFFEIENTKIIERAIMRKTIRQNKQLGHLPDDIINKITNKYTGGKKRKTKKRSKKVKSKKVKRKKKNKTEKNKTKKSKIVICGFVK